VSLLILFFASIVAIFLLALLIKWLYPKSKTALSGADFQKQLQIHGVTGTIDQMLVSTTGKEAIAILKNNPHFAVIRAFGDRYSLRVLNSEQIEQEGAKISLPDYTWPPFFILTHDAETMTNWLLAKRDENDA